MPRRFLLPLDFTCLPALLAVMATSWAAAAEPFPFPAPPPRSKPVYLSPDPLPALPSPQTQPAPAPLRPRLAAPSGIRKIQAVEELPAPPRGGLIPPVRKSVVPNTAETERRVERLQRQLEELHDLLSRPPVEPPVIERSLVLPPAEAGSASEESPFIPGERPAQSYPSAAQPHTSSPVEPPTPAPAHVDAPGAAPAVERPKPSSTGLIKGLPVSAIDRVYVADNLFAAGEYVLANDIYLQVDRRAISGDESGWVEFQLANCSRRLARFDDAKKRYRRVVSDPTLGWLQDMAKWRLDAIDERELLIREHARLDAAIKAHTEVPHATAKQ